MASRTRTSPSPGPPTRRRRLSGATGEPAQPRQPVERTERSPARKVVPPVYRIPPEPEYTPIRRRRMIVGLAAEAAAQAEQAGRARRPVPASSDVADVNLPARRAGSAVVRQGTCPCGLPASASCTGGCGRSICGSHLLNRASRLGWPGPYRSEREHTAYLRGFWANAAPLCAWCREAAGTSALAALPPVQALPDGALERLRFLLSHPHDYPTDAWEQTVRQNGGATAVTRLLAPKVAARKAAQEFDGRKKGEVLVGVSVGGCDATAAYEVIDRDGAVWTVRSLAGGLVRKRRSWAWERACEERVLQLLPRLVELADP